jgi:hypothetical protein
MPVPATNHTGANGAGAIPPNRVQQRGNWLTVIYQGVSIARVVVDVLGIDLGFLGDAFAPDSDENTGDDDRDEAGALG